MQIPATILAESIEKASVILLTDFCMSCKHEIDSIVGGVSNTSNYYLHLNDGYVVRDFDGDQLTMGRYKRLHNHCKGI